MGSDESAESDNVELLARRLISQELSEHRTAMLAEVSAHREYITKLSVVTGSAAFFVIGIITVWLSFAYGDKLKDVEEEMLEQARSSFEERIQNTQSVVDLRLAEQVEQQVKGLKPDIDTLLKEELSGEAGRVIMKQFVSEFEDQPFASALTQVQSTLDAIRLQCKNTTNTVQRPGYSDPTMIVEAKFEEGDLMQGFMITGGGCSVSKQVAQYAADIASSHITADGRGWHYRSEFTASRAVATRITAYATACRVTSD
ncbi:MAG: hypothetical protein AAFY29_11465 [Pseudomonadota bacterium]